MRPLNALLAAALLASPAALLAQRGGYDKGGLFEGLMADHAGANDPNGARRLGTRLGGSGQVDKIPDGRLATPAAGTTPNAHIVPTFDGLVQRSGNPPTAAMPHL